MEPSVFYFSARLIWRRVAVKGGILMLVAIYIYYAPWPPSDWWDYAIAVIGVLYLVEFVRALRIALGPRPSLIISDEGIRDPKIGDFFIPWSAIKKIQTINNPKSMFAGAAILAETRAIDFRKLSPLYRYALGLRRGSGKKLAETPLLMTSPAALENSLDDLLEAIAARPNAAGIAIEPQKKA